TLMIIVSDNLATDKLYHMVGQANVEETMHKLGLKDITIKHSCWELLSLAVGMKPQPYSKEVLEEVKRRLFTDNEFTDEIVLEADKENNLCTPKNMTILLELLNNG